jgi:trimeric autotransporter adhesin
MATGSTTNFGLPYPLASDAVAVHTDMQALATAVDAQLVTATAGLNAHNNVRVATTVALTGTYTPGAATADGGTGNGATFVYVAASFPTIDGATLVAGDRVLLKDQATALQNGIYSVTTVSTNITLTRASDYDNTVAGEVASGDFVFVTAGSTYTNTGWVMNSVGTNTDKSIKVGVDSIAWTLFSNPNSVSAASDATNNTRYLTFADNATGIITFRTGSELTYNPSTGVLTTKSNIQTPNLTTASNALTVQSGNSTTSGNSGAVTLTTGTSTATSGALTISTGNGTTSAGAISIDTGTGGTTTISLGTANATNVTIGRNTGTATIANPTITLSNAATLNINGANPTIATSQTTGTAAILNTGFTGAINLGGASTGAITIGGTSGTSTVAIASMLKPRAAGNGTGLMPIQFTSGTLTSTAGTYGGGIEYDGNALYSFPNSASTLIASGGRAVVESSQISILSAANTTTFNATTTTAQNIFPATAGTLTLAANTTYTFEGLYSFTTGATSVTPSIGFAGTVGVTSIAFEVMSLPAATSTVGTNFFTTLAGGTTALATTATTKVFWVKGVIRASTTGTVIPQITLGATTGSAGQVNPNTYIKFTPVGTNTMTTVGAWA